LTAGELYNYTFDTPVRMEIDEVTFFTARNAIPTIERPLRHGSMNTRYTWNTYLVVETLDPDWTGMETTLSCLWTNLLLYG
jgi:hypothetical protein